MVEWCKEKEILFLLVSIDSIKFLKDKDKEKFKAMDPSFDPFFFETDLRYYAEALNIEYIGLQSVFDKDLKENGEDLHWVHWNYRGHELVAKVLHDKLSSILPARIDTRDVLSVR